MAERSDPPFVVTRSFDAPRELVFRAWTELDRLKQWWGPKGFTMEHCTLDLRPGGMFHYHMRASDGGEMWGKFVFREIVPPEKLVFVTSFSDAAGNTLRAPFSAEFPLEVVSTATFAESNGRTTLTLRGEPVAATEAERGFFHRMFASMTQGWGGSLDQLAEHVAKG
jgi:uncharacterized protein YndB with AHSA1/START domain